MVVIEGELNDHVGYSRHDPVGRNGGNSRNGYRAKTVITEAGPDGHLGAAGSDSRFEPRIVARQRRLTGVDDILISLSAKGLAHGRSPRT